MIFSPLIDMISFFYIILIFTLIDPQFDGLDYFLFPSF